MTKTIWKYKLDRDDETVVHAPAGSTPLTVQLQGGEPYVWMLVDSRWAMARHRFTIHWTGQPLPKEWGAYVATFQLPGRALVAHVFHHHG